MYVILYYIQYELLLYAASIEFLNLKLPSINTRSVRFDNLFTLQSQTESTNTTNAPTYSMPHLAGNRPPNINLTPISVNNNNNH